MGKQKYLKAIEELFKKSPVVDSGSIKRIVSDKRKANHYEKQLIRNLVLAGRIKKLAKGCYTMHDEASLSAYCFSPSYLGLQDALSFHCIWEQETIPVVITAKKARQGIRKILGTNVLVRRISKKYLFGFGYFNQGSFYLPYSDVEKTFIDMVYFNEKLATDSVKVLKKRIDMKKMNVYLKAYPAKLRQKVLKVLA